MQRLRATLACLGACALLAAALPSAPGAALCATPPARTRTTSPARSWRSRSTPPARRRARSRSRSGATAPRSGKRARAIIALAGGPGQSAIPFAEDFAELLGAIADDQRPDRLRPARHRRIGSPHLQGLRARLRRHATGGDDPSLRLPARLVQELLRDRRKRRRHRGDPARGGYEKLVLYGTSYGTKVAEDYAQAYPQHVEALVLDSVVSPGAPELPEPRRRFEAVPRILRRSLSQAARLPRRHPRPRARSRVGAPAHPPRRPAGPRGRPRGALTARRDHRRRSCSTRLLRGRLLGTAAGACSSAACARARSATTPRSRGCSRLDPGEEEEGGEAEGIDIPLYYATSCRTSVPVGGGGAAPRSGWPKRARRRARSAPRPSRRSTAATRCALSDIPACACWPAEPRRRRSPTGPLPAVPTLILSGAYDMRTPTSNAREVAAEIPGSHLLVVPRVGHSVLGAESGDCAEKALQALFAARADRRLPRRPRAGAPASAAAGAAAGWRRSRRCAATAGCRDGRHALCS